MIFVGVRSNSEVTEMRISARRPVSASCHSDSVLSVSCVRVSAPVRRTEVRALCCGCDLAATLRLFKARLADEAPRPAKVML